MRLPPGFKRLLKLAVRPRAVEQDVDDELRFHLELRAEKLQREGLPAAEARERAQRDFGDVERVRAECVRLGHERAREMKRSLWLDALAQDARYAVRTLRKSPSFALVAVLTLALGIGATTALFSIVRGVLLKPLPFPSPERLVRLWQSSPQLDLPRAAISQNDFDDWKAQQRAFSSLGGWWHVEDMTGVDLSGLGDPERIKATFVTDGFFSALGMAPQLGRALLPEENVPGQDAVAVLGHGLWTRRFGADPALVGRTVTLDGAPHTVVGIMPPSFTFPSEQMDVWLPLSRIPETGIPRKRFNRFLSVVGRLQPGVTLETARTELDGLARQLAEVHPESNGQYPAITAIPLHDAITGDVRTGLLVVLGAVGLLLLIACANVANLQLARATLREREMAVRAALGAGPGRLVRQLLTESLVLAGLGGVLGVGLAVWGTELLVELSVEQLPRLREVRVDEHLPLEGTGEDIGFSRPGHPEDAANPPHLNVMHVSTDYFRTLGIPLLGGRGIEPTDTVGRPLIAVVSQTFARRFFPGEDAVGKVVSVGTTEVSIVGVVGDVRQAGLAEPAPPLFYLHVLQATRGPLNLVVRGQGALLPLAASARQAIWSVNPQQTLSRVTTLEEVVSEAVTRPRLLSVMLGLFAVLGLALAAVGIYGVLAYAVSQRQREMGVRLALGAQPADVLRLVLKSGMALAGAGIALGIAGALGLSQVMRSILYGVAPHDPLTFAGVMALLLGVALLACLIPARRAMRVDPAVTLRGE